MKDLGLGRLLVESRRGQTQAFAEIVRRFRPSLLKRAASILRDRHLAEDAVQETLLEAHQKLDTLQYDAAFASWTGRILFKYCDRILRRRSEIVTSPDSLTAEQDPRRENADAAELLSTLSGLDHAIAHSFFAEGMPQKQIARELHIPLHTVKNRLKKVRRELKQQQDNSPTMRAA